MRTVFACLWRINDAHKVHYKGVEIRRFSRDNIGKHMLLGQQFDKIRVKLIHKWSPDTLHFWKIRNPASNASRVKVTVVPFGLALGQPTPLISVGLVLLLIGIYLNSASWMYLAALLEKRQQGALANGEMTTVTMLI